MPTATMHSVSSVPPPPPPPQQPQPPSCGRSSSTHRNSNSSSTSIAPSHYHHPPQQHTTNINSSSTSTTTALSAPLPPSPSSSSMTLAISKNDATRIIEASRTFNTTLFRLLKEEKIKLKEQWKEYQKLLDQHNYDSEHRRIAIGEGATTLASSSSSSSSSSTENGVNSNQEKGLSMTTTTTSSITTNDNDDVEKKSAVTPSSSPTAAAAATTTTSEQQTPPPLRQEEEITTNLKKITVKEEEMEDAVVVSTTSTTIATTTTPQEEKKGSSSSSKEKASSPPPIVTALSEDDEKEQQMTSSLLSSAPPSSKDEKENTAQQRRRRPRTPTPTREKDALSASISSIPSLKEEMSDDDTATPSSLPQVEESKETKKKKNNEKEEEKERSVPQVKIEEETDVNSANSKATPANNTTTDSVPTTANKEQKDVVMMVESDVVVADRNNTASQEERQQQQQEEEKQESKKSSTAKDTKKNAQQQQGEGEEKESDGSPIVSPRKKKLRHLSPCNADKNQTLNLKYQISNEKEEEKETKEKDGDNQSVIDTKTSTASNESSSSSSDGAKTRSSASLVPASPPPPPTPSSSPPTPPSQTPTPLNKLLLPAAKQCNNSFLSSFVSKMEADSNVSEQETETCLLLFLDMDKSSILLTAFAVLGEREEDEKKKVVVVEEEEKDESCQDVIMQEQPKVVSAAAAAASSTTTTTTTTMVKMEEEVEDMEITPTITVDTEDGTTATNMECDSSSSSSLKNKENSDSKQADQGFVASRKEEEEEKKEEEEEEEKDVFKTKTSVVVPPTKHNTPSESMSSTTPPSRPPQDQTANSQLEASSSSTPKPIPPPKPSTETEEDEDDYFELPPEGKLSYKGLVLLFQSFLTSISTCIHHDEHSPASSLPKLTSTSATTTTTTNTMMSSSSSSLLMQQHEQHNVQSPSKRQRAPSPHSVTFSPPPPAAAVSASMEEEDENDNRPSKVAKDCATSSPSSAASRAATAAAAASSSTTTALNESTSSISPPPLVSLSHSGDDDHDNDSVVEKVMAAAAAAGMDKSVDTPCNTALNAAVRPTPARNHNNIDSSGGDVVNQDWTLSSQTKKEIQEIATYAADQLVLYHQKKEEEEEEEKDKSKAKGNHTTSKMMTIVKSEPMEDIGTSTALTATSGSSSSSHHPNNQVDEINKKDVLVSFQVFGEWYNAGGFSLVPWLELLDLAKWDYAGKAAAAAAVEAQEAAAAAAAVASAMTAPLDTPGAVVRSLHHDDDGGGGLDDIHDDGGVVISGSVLDDFGAASPHPLTPGVIRHGSGSSHLYGDVLSHPRSGSSRSGGGGGRPSSSLRRRASTTTSDHHNALAGAPPSPTPDIFSRNTETSRTVVSFDFTHSMPSPSQEFNINITEENLIMLKSLVHRTGLISKTLEEISDVLLRHSVRKKPSMSASRTSSSMGEEDSIMVLKRDDFGKCVRDLVSQEYSRHFDDMELDNYSNYFTNFFTCFEKGPSSAALGLDCVNAKELAVGLSFLCAGNKSTKLSTAFELMDEKGSGYLTQRGLIQYLRSYLTMLMGISLLSASTATTKETRNLLMTQRRSDIFAAVDNGAKWTQGQFLKSFYEKVQKRYAGASSSTRSNAVTFEDFAEWYTEGGYLEARWLELLDLSKFLSLLPEDCTFDPRKSNGLDGGHPSKPPPTHKETAISRVHPSEILFTFPLAKHQSLVVLREDAAYVRTVVTQLGLLSFSCDDIWSAMCKYVRKNPPPFNWQNSQRGAGAGKSRDIDQNTFVQAVDSIVNPPRGKKKKQTRVTSSESKDTLKNFFSSFDLDQVQRVAVNQLMGGLTLLCGGKKSTKLAFSFGLFDGRTAAEKRKRGQEAQSLDEKELFLFFRSFLIVMFSCCKQSLDLSAEAVGRYISETANMVANDVVVYQWRTRSTDRVDFDSFGEWYNEGGYKTAPWLELLDLKKWVLLDGPIDAHPQGETSDGAPPVSSGQNHDEFRNTQQRDDLPENNTHKAEESNTAAPSDHVTNNSNGDDGESIDCGEEDQDCPPPPPDDAMDVANDPFLGDMGLDGIDGVDDMDYILQHASNETPETQNKDSDNHQGGTDSTAALPHEEDQAHEKDVKEEHCQDTHAPAPAPPAETAPPAKTKRQGKRQQKKTEKENGGNYASNNSNTRKNGRSKSVTSNNSNRAQQHQHNSHPPSPGNSLKFHLFTSEDHGGYMISVSQRRIQHLRQLVCESGLYKLDGNLACNRILEKAVQRRQGSGGGSDSYLTKEGFDSAMRSVISASASSSIRGDAGMCIETQHHLSDLLTSIFHTFDRNKCGKVNALELACGFTVLCGGRKSDKLEYAFELLDEKKQGKYAHNDMIRYLQSFLVVLLSISSSSSLVRDSREDVMTTMDGTHCGNSASNILKVIDFGSSWATKQVFRSVAGVSTNSKSKSKANRNFICFDDFAEWYTSGGYRKIQWLELLDLRKWVLADKT